jgi:hypothetical protein
MVVDAIIVPIVIPATSITQPPTRTRKTRIHVPIRTIRIPVTEVVVDVAIVDTNVDIRIVPNAGSITADAWTVNDIVPRVVSNVGQIDIRAISSNHRTIYVARQCRWSTRQRRWTSTADHWTIDVAR